MTNQTFSNKNYVISSFHYFLWDPEVLKFKTYCGAQASNFCDHGSLKLVSLQLNALNIKFLWCMVLSRRSRTHWTVLQFTMSMMYGSLAKREQNALTSNIHDIWFSPTSSCDDYDSKYPPPLNITHYLLLHYNSRQSVWENHTLQKIEVEQLKFNADVCRRFT